jgi:hypothetical protein
LLVNAADALDRPDLIGVLTAQIAGMLGFDLPFSFALLFRFRHGLYLRFSQDHRLALGQFRRQRFQPQLKVGQIVSLPD